MHDYIDLSLVKEFCEITGDDEKSTIKFIEDSVIQNDKFIIKKLIQLRDNKNSNETTIKIANKLLGDIKLRKKLRLVESGLLHICIYEYMYCGDICGNEAIYGIPSGQLRLRINNIAETKLFKYDIKKKLDWIKNNFEIIPICFLE